jgi:hypothetical protein
VLTEREVSHIFAIQQTSVIFFIIL